VKGCVTQFNRISKL